MSDQEKCNINIKTQVVLSCLGILVESFSQGGLFYENDEAVDQKIRTKQVKRTNLCMAQAFFDP